VRKSIPCLSLFCLLTICLPAKAEGPKPIVAVFQIEAKRITLDAKLLEALTDILSAKLTATGSFEVVPKNEIKKRLLTAKRESYKDCFDQKCQIELGRELAADKTLHGQIIKIGTSCEVSVTLHDLKKASSEAAATTSGGCTEDEISKSLTQVVAKLAGKDKATRNTRSGPIPPPTRKFVVVKSPEPSPPKVITDEQRRQQTEWVDLVPVVGYELEDGILLGSDLFVASLKWEDIAWTIMELGFWSGAKTNLIWHIGSRPFVPINLDPKGKHSLRIGLGVDIRFWDNGGSESDHEEFLGLYVSPGIGYTFRTDVGLRIGVQLNASLCLFFDSGDRRPIMFMLGIPISWQAPL